MDDKALTPAEPVPEVTWDLVEGKHRVRLGVGLQDGRVQFFASTEKKKGKRWVQDARTSVAPNLPGMAGPLLAGALKMFAEKKAEVDEVMKEWRPQRASKRKARKSGTASR